MTTSIKRLFLLAPIIILLLAYAVFFTPPETRKIPTIGFISLTKVDQQTFKGFTEAMKQYGYIEGKSVVYRNDGPAEKIENLAAIVQKQLKEGVDLFFVSSTPATQAVQNATINTVTPVVFCPVNDPVASGIVTSLEYPGGNITGIKLPVGDKKRFEWLLEMIPTAKRILVPYTPGDKSSEFSRMEAFYAVQHADVELVELPVTDETALPMLLQQHKNVDAIFLPRDSSIESNIAKLVAFADKNRLPLCTPSLQQVEEGALFAYGFIHGDMGRQAAHIANAILRGTKPSDLPVETAKNHLIINLDTAKKIGLTLDKRILAKADRIIGAH